MKYGRSSEHDHTPPQEAPFEFYWPHHHSGPWRGAPPWAIEVREMLRVVILNQRNQMSQADDLNNAVTSLASAFAVEHDAVVKELDELAKALAATQNPDPALSEAVTNAISNITHVTGQMAIDAAALTDSIPAATTVPPPVITEPPTEPTVEVPTIATPAVTDPSATPPSEPPADATTVTPEA